jgi:hypothetical protein
MGVTIILCVVACFPPATWVFGTKCVSATDRRAPNLPLGCLPPQHALAGSAYKTAPRAMNRDAAAVWVHVQKSLDSGTVFEWRRTNNRRSAHGTTRSSNTGAPQPEVRSRGPKEASP